MTSKRIKSSLEKAPVPVEIEIDSETMEQAYQRIQRARGKPAISHVGVSRLDALDVARGFAICLMILSHGVKGLMTFEQMPAWGLVPIHLITKFSSSLFILVFGMALSISVVPHIGTDKWPAKRKKLLITGLVIFFWYKALTILEMSHLYSRNEILDTLMYKSFPVYVEILGFYSIALLWIPFALPLWKASHAVVRFLIPVALIGLTTLLTKNFDFFGSEIFQAFLVEHPNHYAWGQLSRAPLVFVGLLLGWMIQSSAATRWPRLIPVAVLLGASALLFSSFVVNSGDLLYQNLVLIAENSGKHPPEMQFMLFSLGGALLILGLAVWGGRTLSKVFAPISLIGRNSMRAFIFHIVVIFVFYRYLFDYFHKVEYTYALFLGLSLIAMTAVWLKVTQWVRSHT